MARVLAVQPPLNDPPIANYPSGQQHSQAWTEYHQSVADRLTTLTANLGVTDGSDAATGQVGEYLEASGGPVTLTSGVNANIATLPLTAGDWDVSGNVQFTPAATTHPVEFLAGVSSVSATPGGVFQWLVATFTVGVGANLGAAGPVRMSISAGATAYLVARSTFTTSTMTATGRIRARRMR